MQHFRCILWRKQYMTLTELCLILAALFAFATLILKVIEVSRSK
jgi:hypothetical protein